MASAPESMEFIVSKLYPPERFRTRAMFGDYALYADGKVAALICDDQLYVKIMPESASLAEWCEQDCPFVGAKPHYIVEESQLDTIEELSGVLLAMAEVLPFPKKKTKKKR